MTTTKPNRREQQRKMQLPLLVLLGAMPLPLLFGALITPDAWAAPVCTGVAYLLAAWLLLFLPGRVRVPVGIACCVGVLAVGFVTMPIMQSPELAFLSVIFIALLIYSFQMGGWPPDQELHLFVTCVFFILHIVAQFLINADMRLGDEGLYVHIRTPLLVSFIAFMLLYLLSLNRDNMLRAVNGGSRAPIALRRRNLILMLTAFALAIGIAALPAVIEAATALWNKAWEAIGNAILWLFTLFQGQGTTSGPPEGGSGEAGGLPYSLETSPLAALMEKIMLVVAVILLILIALWALRIIFRNLKKLMAYLYERMKRYATLSSEDYTDEITDVRDVTGERETVLSALRKRITTPRVDEKSLSPRERIRYLYSRMRRKHPEWLHSATARESIPESPAELYERARYSEHEITETDAASFHARTKGL